MDLINDLENEMAFAFFVEKKHCQKIDSKDSLALIRTLRMSLIRFETRTTDPDQKVEFERAARAVDN